MDIGKQAHVNAIRANTAYPTYRGIIGIITTILMIIAGLQGLGAIIGGITLMSQYGFAGFIVLLIGAAFAALTFFLAKFWKEAAQIIADIGDSAMDANANIYSLAPPALPPLVGPAITPPAY